MGEKEGEEGRKEERERRWGMKEDEEKEKETRKRGGKMGEGR